MVDTANARASARRPAGKPVRHPPGSEADLAAFREQMGAIGEPLSKEARARRAVSLFDEQRDRLIREYRRYGLDPVFADKESRVVVSIPMLIKLGWKIKVVGANQFELVQPVAKKQKRYVHRDRDNLPETDEVGA